MVGVSVCDRYYLADTLVIMHFLGIRTFESYHFPAGWFAAWGTKMVAYKNERRVFMWHVMPKPIPKETPFDVGLPELLAILRSSYDAHEAEIYFSDEGRKLKADASPSEKDPKNRIYIADLKETDETISFLINRGDPSVADPAYIDARNATVRTISPGPDESPGSSAHLVIQKAAGDAHTHRACFERMPHVSSSHAELLIGDILARYATGNSKYVYPKRVKRGREFVIEHRTYRPALSVRKVPSDTLRQDIERGELSGITLIDTKSEYQGPDTPSVVRSAKKKLSIRLKPVDKGRVFTYLGEITTWGREEGYNELQLDFAGFAG
jgi:hypothetical protein